MNNDGHAIWTTRAAVTAEAFARMVAEECPDGGFLIEWDLLPGPACAPATLMQGEIYAMRSTEQTIRHTMPQ